MTDIAAIRERHYSTTVFSPEHCVHDHQSWPCDVALLLAATPSVEPPNMDEFSRGYATAVRDHGPEEWKREVAALRPSVEPAGMAGIERRVHTIESRLFATLRRTGMTPTDARSVASQVREEIVALLPTQASDSPENRDG